MKNKKKICVLLTVMVMTFILASCGSTTIVGTWTMEQDGTTTEYTFNEDQTGQINMAGITLDTSYAIEGDKITITMKVLGQEQKMEYTYQINKDALTLTDSGNSFTMNKKK